ncbi:MAG TPA: hypothetical protein VNZ52_11580, partial [Candidatus Thermoplasmatota archaeon]|nr:hypothetical protein [Candidatus Thermoplasmatota archaeon]
MPRAPPLLVVAALLLPGLLGAADLAAATSPIFSITPRNSTGVYSGEYQLSEIVYFDLYVKAGSRAIDVYRDLRISQLTPTGTVFIGTITDGSQAIQLLPGQSTLVRIAWDQVPTGAGRSVDPGRYRITYFDSYYGEVGAVVIDLGYNPDLVVNTLSVRSAPLPPPARTLVPEAPQPLMKRVEACVANVGTEPIASAQVGFYHRSSLDDPSSLYLFRTTTVRFDGTFPACPGGAGTLVSFDWILPADSNNRSLTSDTVVAIADPSGKVMETNEGN